MCALSKSAVLFTHGFYIIVTFLIAEMTTEQTTVNWYDGGYFVSASIKADPRVNEYSVLFSDNGFILSADG